MENLKQEAATEGEVVPSESQITPAAEQPEEGLKEQMMMQMVSTLKGIENVLQELVNQVKILVGEKTEEGKKESTPDVTKAKRV